jgi:APA family basic amino acid/polyamine antiporter
MAATYGGAEKLPGELRRQLGLSSATALVVGEVIGVGIFLTPAGMAKSLGSPFWLFCVWLVMGAITLAGALTFGELAARYPEAGGLYAFLRRAYGARIAFLFGWMSLLVTDPGLTALLAVGIARYVGYIVPLSSIKLKLVAVVTIIMLACVNILGVRLGANLLRGVAWLKLALLGFLALWGFALGLGSWSNFAPFVAQRAGSEELGPALLTSMIAAFFSFAGWWDMSKVAGEVDDPSTTLPRALGLGVAIVTLVYLVVSAAFLYLVPLSRVRDDEGFAALAGEALFGRTGGLIFAIVVIVCVFGSLASVIMSSPRVYFAMARDGVFLPAVAEVHPRFGTPARAILLQAVLASILVASGSFEQILGYFFFVTVAFLAMAVAAIYRLRPDPSETAVARTPGYPFTPLGFLIPIGAVLVMLALKSPLRTLLGLVIVALGIPAYQILFGKAQRSVVKTDPAGICDS